MKKVSQHIPGYSYGTAEVARSPVSMRELDDLKISAGFAEEDQRYLRPASEVLADQSTSQPSFHRTAMPMKKAWGMHGLPSGATGAYHLLGIVKRCARL